MVDFDFATAFALVVAHTAEDDSAAPEIRGGGGGGTILDDAFAFATGTARTSDVTTLEALGTTLVAEDESDDPAHEVALAVGDPSPVVTTEIPRRLPPTDPEVDAQFRSFRVLRLKI